MPAHPRLTVDQLREIQTRRRADLDVTALLWEVHRLRAMVLSADRFMRSISAGVIHGTYAELSAKDLRSRLLREPLSSKKQRRKRGVSRRSITGLGFTTVQVSDTEDESSTNLAPRPGERNVAGNLDRLHGLANTVAQDYVSGSREGSARTREALDRLSALNPFHFIGCLEAENYCAELARRDRGKAAVVILIECFAATSAAFMAASSVKKPPAIVPHVPVSAPFRLNS